MDSIYISNSILQMLSYSVHKVRGNIIPLGTRSAKHEL